MSWDSDFQRWENKVQTGLLKKSSNPKSCSSVLPRAGNIIEWTISPQFLNCPQVIDKYKRQFEILRSVAGIYCPVCNSTRAGALDCFDKSRFELESQVLLRWDEREQDEVCPRCKNTKRGLVEDGMIEPVDTLTLCVGMRSGKSVLAAIIASYQEHELAHIGDLGAYFDLLPGDPLQVSFLATTGKQSAATVFAKFKALRQESPWTNRYIAWVKEQEKAQATSSSMSPWEYVENASEIRNGLISVSFQALNSNSASLAGATRLGVYIDELSRFDLSESARSADEILKVMTQGLKTIREASVRRKLRSFWGLLCCTSSPISIEDKTMQMVKQKLPGCLNYHLATWEMNPDLPRSAFTVEFLRDAAGAARDFGAAPPNAVSPFVDDEARFRQAIDFDTQPTVLFDRTEPVDRTGRKYVGAQIVDCKYDPYQVHYVRFDAGASFDTFAGCSAHGEWEEVVDKQGQRSRKFVTVVDWVLGIAPVLGKTQAEKRTVWFDSVVEILGALSKQTKIGLVTFDRWNSEKLIQDIRNLGIESENRSVKTFDFMNFLRAAYEGDVRMLPPRPNEPTDPRQKNDAEKAIYELLRLERSTDLTRIYNPKKGQVHGMNSDDLAQVVVGAHMDVQRSIVSSSGPTTSPAEALKREIASSEYNNLEGGGGRIARGRSW